MSHSRVHRHPRSGLVGSFTCVLLTCVVAPPLVRGAAEPAAANDGGGCNGGRKIGFGAESEGTTTGGSSSTGETGETTEVAGRCGDGTVDVGEGCDDGNDVEEDACPSGALGMCKAVAVCGDGFVWEGMEGCDGGEGCGADCEVLKAVCGNGVMEAGEGCDDGNDVDEDMCPSGAEGECKAAAVCGDGIVWDGVEGCDDGNSVDEDGCPSGEQGMCGKEAVCGDGIVWEGEEECDDGNGVDLDGCSDACARPRWVFVTSTNVNGNLGGVAGADGHCQGLAMGAGLPGTYMAWLTGADAGSAPKTRFGSTGFTGWYLLPGNPATGVAQGWEDLTSPNEGMPAEYLRNAIYRDEKGVDIFDGSAWTNTTPEGGQQTKDVNCSDWASASAVVLGQTGRAIDGGVDAKWTDDSPNKCNSGSRLYCFQVK